MNKLYIRFYEKPDLGEDHREFLARIFYKEPIITDTLEGDPVVEYTQRSVFTTSIKAHKEIDFERVKLAFADDVKRMAKRMIDAAEIE